MEINKFISSLLLTTAASSTFALNNQAIVTLLNQQAKQPTHHAYHSKQNNSQLHWASLHGPKMGNAVHIVQMKNNASMLFAFRPNTYGVVNKSTDGGQHWKTLPTPKNVTVYDLISIDENHLLLAADKSIYSSDDKGEHWKLSTNLGERCQQLFALNPNLILLGTNYNSGIPGVYRSLNGGETWSPARLGLNTEWVEGMSGRDNLLFIGAMGLNISTNGGALWTQFDKWKHDVKSVAVSSLHDVFVAADYKLYKTDTHGQTWDKMDVIGHIESVKIDNNDNIYVKSRNYDTKRDSLYQSVDNGKTWKLLQEFASIFDVTLLDNGDIIVSTNEGLMQYDKSRSQFVKLPVNFSVSETIKVSALDENNLFAIDGLLWGPLSSSHDGGKTWNVARAEDVRDVSAFNNQLIEIEWDKSGNGTHLLTSIDKGQSWQEISSPAKKSCDRLSSQPDALVLTCNDGQYLTRDLSHWKMSTIDIEAVSYVSGKSIYTSNGKSIKRSDDDGQTWTTLLDNLNQYKTRITGYQNKVVLIAVSYAGIIKTTDGGINWDLINNGIEDYHFTDIKALDENNYFVATDSGVYTTRDGGNHWVAENNGLDNFDIKSLFANQDMLLVGTNGSGVFKATLKK